MIAYDKGFGFYSKRIGSHWKVLNYGCGDVCRRSDFALKIFPVT